VVSAKSGEGLPELLAALEAALPGRDTEVSALVPYGRGDLVARAHREGEVLALAHCEGGTQLTARVPPDLAAQLAGASVAGAAGGSVSGARVAGPGAAGGGVSGARVAGPGAAGASVAGSSAGSGAQAP
jgi:hypothetical protein